jgi:hypothetical protein
MDVSCEIYHHLGLRNLRRFQDIKMLGCDLAAAERILSSRGSAWRLKLVELRPMSSTNQNRMPKYSRSRGRNKVAEKMRGKAIDIIVLDCARPD